MHHTPDRTANPLLTSGPATLRTVAGRSRAIALRDTWRWLTGAST